MLVLTHLFLTVFLSFRFTKGHFRLTNVLMPSLLKSADARVVSVSSSAHLFAATVDWDDLNAEEPNAYAPWKAYGLSKLGNILFTKALQKRVDAVGGEKDCTEKRKVHLFPYSPTTTVVSGQTRRPLQSLGAILPC